MMNSQGWVRGVLILLLGAIAACSSTVDTASVVPDKSSEAMVTAESTAQPAATQIVTLTSLTADIVQTLGDNKLVGIPGSPILQEDDRFAGLEVVSQGRTEPDLEKIVALQPDLVIGAEGFHDKSLSRLEELGIPTLAVNVTGWDALKAVTETLAQQTGTNPQPLLERYDACLAKAPNEAPSALVLVSRQPLLSPNKDSWAGDFLAKFNIQNLTAELQGQSPFDGYITLSEEKVLEANPETLLVVDTGDNLLGQLQGDPFWGQLNATKESTVYTFDYFGLVNPGSLASIEKTCAELANL